MKHVKHITAMLSELHAKKQKGTTLEEKDKIKHLIEKEIHYAEVKHNKAMRNYIILFSLALLILTIIYMYHPKLPAYIIVINILIAIVIFITGIYLISSGYKREIKDYKIIEEHLNDLKK